MALILQEYPPNFEKIIAKLKPGPGTVFAYDRTIYAPNGAGLPYHLIAHEEIHFQQQEDIGGSEIWWDRYIEDPGFRLDQEIEAYRAQYKSLFSRSERRSYLSVFAGFLSSPMYGSIISKAEASRLIRDGE